MAIHLKRATVQDMEEYIRIEKAVDSALNLVTTDPEEAQEEIKNSVTYLITLDDEIVGLISYKVKNTLDAHIAEVAILPAFQGKGIGTKVLELIIDELMQKGFKSVDLETHPDNKALHLYEKFDFKAVGRIENYENSGTPRLVLKRGL